MRKGMEIRRSTVADEHEVADGKLVGYAALFESDAPEVMGVIESIDRSAFNKTVQEQDIAALFNHDPNMPLGRSSAGTLRLSIDRSGLHYEIDLGTSPAALNVREAVERGDVAGSSFAGRIIRMVDIIPEDGRGPIRTVLEEIALRDVGPVTFPYYPQTSSELRSLSDDLAIARALDPEAVWDLAQTVGIARAIVGGEVEAEQPAGTVRRHRFAHLI